MSLCRSLVFQVTTYFHNVRPLEILDRKSRVAKMLRKKTVKSDGGQGKAHDVYVFGANE